MQVEPVALKIANLNFRTTNTALFQELRQFGCISVAVSLTRDGLSKGWATAFFIDTDHARAAHLALDQHTFEGRVLAVELPAITAPPTPTRASPERLPEEPPYEPPQVPTLRRSASHAARELARRDEWPLRARDASPLRQARMNVVYEDHRRDSYRAHDFYPRRY
jgi:hypothetical protein